MTKAEGRSPAPETSTAAGTRERAAQLTRQTSPRARSRGPAAFVPSSYFGCQTTKRAGPLAPPQEAGPLRSSLYEVFRDLGAGAAPAELTLIPATILKRHAFGSERVPLNKSAAEYGG